MPLQDLSPRELGRRAWALAADWPILSDDELAAWRTYVESRSASELRKLDESVRPSYYEWLDPTRDALAARVAEERLGDAPIGVLWIAAMSPRGFMRQRAVEALAARRDETSSRVIAVRTRDHVGQVASLSSTLIVGRVSERDAMAIVPVLSAFGDTRRGADALAQYRGALEPTLRQHIDLRLCLEGEDSATRRAAIVRLTHDPLTRIDDLAAVHAGTLDAGVARTAVDAIVGIGVDPAVLSSLSRSRFACARAASLTAHPAADVSPEDIARGLLDSSAQVRAAARIAWARSGGDPADFYVSQPLSGVPAKRLAATLRGLIETSADTSHVDVPLLAGHAAAAVRRVAILLLDADKEGMRALKRCALDRSSSVARSARIRLGPLSWDPTDEIAALASSDSCVRRRAWQVLHSRGDWESVIADVCACADRDEGTAKQARNSLSSWVHGGAATMWRPPTPSQLDRLQRAISVAGIVRWERARILFAAGVSAPLEPR